MLPTEESKAPSKFSIFTDRLWECMILSLIDTTVIYYGIFNVLLFCKTNLPFMSLNFAAVLTIMFTLNWYFRLREIRHNTILIKLININVVKNMNLSTMLMIQNSAIALKKAIAPLLKPEETDDKDVDKPE